LEWCFLFVSQPATAASLSYITLSTQPPTVSRRRPANLAAAAQLTYVMYMMYKEISAGRFDHLLASAVCIVHIACVYFIFTKNLHSTLRFPPRPAVRHLQYVRAIDMYDYVKLLLVHG
jgi:hypothetical protein